MGGTDGFSDANFMGTFGNSGNHNTGDTNRADNNRDNGNNGKQDSDKFDIGRSGMGNLFFGCELEGASEVRIIGKFFI